jgi:hypothetical protein
MATLIINRTSSGIGRASLVILMVIILVVASVYFLFVYVPPPVTAVTTDDCSNIGLPASNSSSSEIDFAVTGINLSMSFSPPARGVEIGSCVYRATNITAPVGCGGFCWSYGLGDAYLYSKQLAVSIYFEQPTTPPNYSMLISAHGVSLFGLFLPSVQIYFNSRNVTWNPSPYVQPYGPCKTSSYYDYPTCAIDTNTTALAVQFPVKDDCPVSGGGCQLLINSSEMLLP